MFNKRVHLLVKRILIKETNDLQSVLQLGVLDGLPTMLLWNRRKLFVERELQHKLFGS